jgi:hypothetical protein
MQPLFDEVWSKPWIRTSAKNVEWMKRFETQLGSHPSLWLVLLEESGLGLRLAVVQGLR